MLVNLLRSSSTRQIPPPPFGWFLANDAQLSYLPLSPTTPPQFSLDTGCLALPDCGRAPPQSQLHFSDPWLGRLVRGWGLRDWTADLSFIFVAVGCLSS